MLIYCLSYIGFGKNLLTDITKAFLGPSQHIKVEHCLKIDEIRAFSNSYFLVFGQNRKFVQTFGTCHNGNAATMLFCVIPAIALYIEYTKIPVEKAMLCKFLS